MGDRSLWQFKIDSPTYHLTILIILSESNQQIIQMNLSKELLKDATLEAFSGIFLVFIGLIVWSYSLYWGLVEGENKLEQTLKQSFMVQLKFAFLQYIQL